MSWRKITCEERDALVDRIGRSYNGLADPYTVVSGRSDLDGEFGEPEVRSDWGHRDTGALVLRDIRYPERRTTSAPEADPPMPDAHPCEHYAFEEDGW